jgi:hypothetical protein
LEELATRPMRPVEEDLVRMRMIRLKAIVLFLFLHDRTLCFWRLSS